MMRRRAAPRNAGPLFAGFLFLFSISLQAQSGGPKIFKANCAECHGANGDAKTTMGKSLNMRDLRSPEVQKRTDADLTDIITNGMAVMPRHKYKLTKDEIQQVLAYIRQLAKK